MKCETHCMNIPYIHILTEKAFKSSIYCTSLSVTDNKSYLQYTVKIQRTSSMNKGHDLVQDASFPSEVVRRLDQQL